MGSGERLSDDELAAIAARAEAATAGPWEATGTSVTDWKHDECTYTMEACIHSSSGARKREREATARFIAHARVDVPRLLAEVARLRAVEAAAITACELEGGPGEDAALEALRAALRGGR